MNAIELIEAMGGTAAVAKFCGIKAPSVSGWKEAGRIPEDKLVRLALIAESRGIATRKQIFPAEWWVIWPELAQAAALADIHSPALALDRAMTESSKAGLIEQRQAAEPWDGKTERRKLDAPIDCRMSPESVARAKFLRSQSAAKQKGV